MQTLAHLNDILHVTLAQSAPEKIPRSQELNTVNHYLAIEQICFSDRLQIKSPLARRARRRCTVSAPVKLQLAPLRLIRASTRQRHAPSMTPVAIEVPLFSAPALTNTCYDVLYVIELTAVITLFPVPMVQ